MHSDSPGKWLHNWLVTSGVTGGGGGAGGQSAHPETSDWEISADLSGSGKDRQGKKGKWGKKQGKLKKRRWKKEKKGNGVKKKENWKSEGGKLEMEGGKVTKWGDFFFFFAVHFSKWLKFVLGLPKWKFSTGKKHFTSGKKSGKITLHPQKNFPVMPLLVTPAISTNKSKKLTQLIAPIHNIHAANFEWKTTHMASQTITCCLWSHVCWIVIK